MSEFQKSFSRILCTIKFGCKSHQSHAVNRLQKSLINLIRFGSMYYSLRAVGIILILGTIGMRTCTGGGTFLPYIMRELSIL